MLAAAILVGLPASAGAKQPPRFRGTAPCFHVHAILGLTDGEVRRVLAAIHRRTRYPVKSIDPPASDEGAPVGAIEVTILTDGDCESGKGDRYWVTSADFGSHHITVKKVVGVVWLGRLH